MYISVKLGAQLKLFILHQFEVAHCFEWTVLCRKVKSVRFLTQAFGFWSLEYL